VRSAHRPSPRPERADRGRQAPGAAARTRLPAATLALGALALAAALPCVSWAEGAGAAGHPPDLSGIWTQYSGAAGAPLGGRRPPLPLTALGQQKLADYRQLVAPDDTPGAHCLGSGMPESMMFSGIYPMEIIQRPEQITIIYEAHSEIRRLYFGDRILAPGDRIPDRNGYSAAHWEGDTLVVETSALKEQEDQMYPHSDQARIVERYRLQRDPTGGRVLVVDWSMIDPLFYTRPVHAQKRWSLDPHGVLLPYECDEEAWLDHLQQLRARSASAAHPAPVNPTE
jgi:hypothetical protein